MVSGLSGPVRLVGRARTRQLAAISLLLPNPAADLDVMAFD